VDGRSRFEEIVRTTPWLVRALEAARDVDAPDWLLRAGALRTKAWDRRHEPADPRPPADVDVGFFDPADLSAQRDAAVEGALCARLGELAWDAKNQVAVHVWYPRRFGLEVEPFARTADAAATFPETAVCVGVRLERDGRLTVVAPYGLEDLLGLVHRHNPRRAPVAEFRRRLRDKRIRERWPPATIVAPGPTR
jgi:uncharacterized protein